MHALGIDIGGGSVKTAVLRQDQVISTSQSPAYRRPTAEQLGEAVRLAVQSLGSPIRFDTVGLCVPGLLDESRRRVVQSVNVPGLTGVVLGDFLAQNLGLPQGFNRLALLPDAQATATDIFIHSR